MAVRGAHGARRAALAGAVATATAAILLGAAIAAPAGDGAAPASNGGTGGSHHAHHGGNPASPYRGDGMWIWYVSQSSGGDLTRIARKAHRHGIETVYIKSSDGSSSWSQFTPGLVSYLHSRHLRVCGWQFVYGTHPGAEAKRGAAAVRKGADCLVIDAESSYEGRYASADTYMKKLRHKIGRPLPDRARHLPLRRLSPRRSPTRSSSAPAARITTCPSSTGTRSGPRSQGATSTPSVSIASIAEPSTRSARRTTIRRSARSGASGGWRSPTASAASAGGHGRRRTSREWRALGRDIDRGVAGIHRSGSDYPPLSKGSRGDLVVWAQEHLRGAGESVPVTGYFGHKTRRAVKRFQRSNGFIDDGHIGAKTWHALLAVAPKTVNWSGRGSRHLATRSAGRRCAALRLAARGARRDPARIRALDRRASPSRPSSLRARSGRPAPRWYRYRAMERRRLSLASAAHRAYTASDESPEEARGRRRPAADFGNRRLAHPAAGGVPGADLVLQRRTDGDHQRHRARRRGARRRGRCPGARRGGDRRRRVRRRRDPDRPPGGGGRWEQACARRAGRGGMRGRFGAARGRPAAAPGRGSPRRRSRSRATSSACCVEWAGSWPSVCAI